MLLVPLYSFEMLSYVRFPRFATQILAPSKATATGAPGTGKLPRLAPLLARSLVTVLLLEFVTHMLVPSNATPVGTLPTAKVPSNLPSLARTAYQDFFTLWKDADTKIPVLKHAKAEYAKLLSGRLLRTMLTEMRRQRAAERNTGCEKHDFRPLNAARETALPAEVKCI